MAVHQPATITPEKLELLQAWVARQSWAEGLDTSMLMRLGTFDGHVLHVR